MEPNTYAGAGVNVAQAESFVQRLKYTSRRPSHDQLWKGAGGYASVLPITGDLAVALTTDGVGTKLMVAAELGKLETIGIDLVAMCVNDLICVGATPTSFLDYYATPHLRDADADAVIKGIVEGCDRSGIPLVGGETAELPGLYAEGHFDLAGFATGVVTRKALLTPEEIKAGDTVIGVLSTGIHSNGFSLARKLIPSGHPLYEQLLIPTAVYVRPAVEALKRFRHQIKGIAHITGGGWRNLFRLNPRAGYVINNPPPLPPVLHHLLQFVEPEEMYKTFNMGIGLMLVVSSDEAEIMQTFRRHGFSTEVVGRVTDDAATMVIHAEKVVGRRVNVHQ